MAHSSSAALAHAALAAACLLFAPLAHAGKADDQAKKAIREAMEDDYLATNMTTAVALGLMLAWEPKEPGIMQRPPRDPRRSLLTAPVVFRTLLVSAVLVNYRSAGLAAKESG